MRGSGILRGDRRHGLGLGVLAVSAFLVFSSAAMASDPPTIESESVSGVSEHDATLEAQIETGGLYTGYEFQIDTTGSFDFSGPVCPFSFPDAAECDAILASGETMPGGVEPKPQYLAAATSAQAITLDLASVGVVLQPGMTYHYRVIATDGGGPTIEGSDQTFMTPSTGATETAPSIDSVSVSNITEHDATLEAQINPDGLETTYEFHLASPACQSEWPVVGPCFAISGFPLPSATLPAGFGDQTLRLDINTAGKTLQPGTWYEYAVTASNADGKVTGHNAGEGPGIGRNFAGGGGEQNFKTLSANGAPSEVVTEPAEQTASGYKLQGKLNPGGLPTTYYFEYIGASEVECLGVETCWPETAHMGPVTGDSDQQIAPIEVTGLRAGETYRYRLVASNSQGTVRGQVLTFTTALSAPGRSSGEEKSSSTDEKPSSTPTGGGTSQSGASNSTTSPSSTSGSNTSLLPPLVKPAEPKALTQAQKLAKVLEQCKKDKPKRKQAVCEKQAEKKYGSRTKKHKRRG